MRRLDQDANHQLFGCFTPNKLNGLDLPAEVSFRSFIMWALKGPVMFGKVLGYLNVQKEAELCLKNSVRLY